MLIRPCMTQRAPDVCLFAALHAALALRVQSAATSACYLLPNILSCRLARSGESFGTVQLNISMQS